MHAVCGTALEFSGSDFTVTNSFFHLNGEQIGVPLVSIACRVHPAMCAGDHFGRLTGNDQHSWSDGLTVGVRTRSVSSLLKATPSLRPTVGPRTWCFRHQHTLSRRQRHQFHYWRRHRRIHLGQHGERRGPHADCLLPITAPDTCSAYRAGAHGYERCIRRLHA